VPNDISLTEIAFLVRRQHSPSRRPAPTGAVAIRENSGWSRRRCSPWKMHSGDWPARLPSTPRFPIG